jgi:hypothetical protein
MRPNITNFFISKVFLSKDLILNELNILLKDFFSFKYKFITLSL